MNPFLARKSVAGQGGAHGAARLSAMYSCCGLYAGASGGYGGSVWVLACGCGQVPEDSGDERLVLVALGCRDAGMWATGCWGVPVCLHPNAPSFALRLGGKGWRREGTQASIQQGQDGMLKSGDHLSGHCSAQVLCELAVQTLGNAHFPEQDSVMMGRCHQPLKDQGMPVPCVKPCLSEGVGVTKGQGAMDGAVVEG